MIKFHDIKNKNLFDLCPPSINEKNWDNFRAKYKKAENFKILDAPPQIDIELNAGDIYIHNHFLIHG